jgi:hypothetical protein
MNRYLAKPVAQNAGAWREIATAGAPGLREQVEIKENPLRRFLAIRAGNAENLSSVEAGLRFARLWDANQSLCR